MSDMKWDAPNIAAELRLGTVRLDEQVVDNASTWVVVSEEGLEHFRRDLYVSIRDREQDVEFLGRVVEGPYHQNGASGGSDDRAADSYGVYGIVELMGQLEEGTRLVPTPVRPRPDSDVFPFPTDRLRKLLGVEGDFYLGRLIGGEEVRVHMRSDDKNFLPRNVGIFGTVGSGKSNTMQVLMEEAIDAGWAVVTVDVEGEYVRMSDGSDDPRMIELLREEHGLEARGIDDFHVYVPASGNTAAESPVRFKVPISAMEPEIIADILEFTEGHVRMFEAATKQASSRNEYLQRQDSQDGPPETSRAPAPDPHSSSRGALPGVPAGHRTMPGVPPGNGRGPSERVGSPAAQAPMRGEGGAAASDVAVAAPAKASSSNQRPYTLQDLIDGLQESNQSVPLIPRIRAEDLPTAAALRAKLVHLGRSDVLDWNATQDIPELPVEDLLVAGRLSVLDVAEADDRSRNIAIAYTLQALFERVVQTPIGERMPNGQPRPPLLVVVEEVHTFVSRATAHRMRAVLDNLQVISRRGRKRWMALALVSQQPNHVPDELFELANTRFMHQMKSLTNVNAVKETTGGVHEALWSTVSSLGPGQCLMASSALGNAMLLAARPARSRRAFSR